MTNVYSFLLCIDIVGWVPGMAVAWKNCAIYPHRFSFGTSGKRSLVGTSSLIDYLPLDKNTCRLLQRGFSQRISWCDTEETEPHTHTHPFNGPFSGTTRMSRYQKGKTNLDFTEARDSEWQWHQLGHMQVCISLQTDNHASTPPLKSFLQAGCPSCCPTNSVKALKAKETEPDVTILNIQKQLSKPTHTTTTTTTV